MRKRIFAKRGYILIAILLYLSGISCILIPNLDMQLACRVCGLILIFHGIVKVFGFFSKDLYCLAFQFDFAFGLLMLLLGTLLLVRTQRMESLLLPIVGVVILTESLLRIQTAMDARRFGLETWHVLLTLAIISGFCSTLLLIHPFANDLLLRWSMGGAFIAAGLLNHSIALCTVADGPVSQL